MPKVFVRRVLLSLCLGLLFQFPGVQAGQAIPADYSIYPHIDRIENVSGRVFAVEAYSLFGADYFAVANEATGVNIFKVIDGELVHMGDGQALGSERDIAVNGWNAFVATGSIGISSLSVAIPESPIELDHLNLPGTPVRLAVSPTHAFVACGTGGLSIVDISDPSNMLLAGSYGIDVKSVCIDGNRLSVVNEGRLEILDITIPTVPVLLGSHQAPTLTGFLDAVLLGDVAYTCFYDRVEKLDISDPAAIVVDAELFLNFTSQLYRGRLNIHGAELLVSAQSYLAFIDFETAVVNRESRGFGTPNDVAILGGKMVVTDANRVGIYNDGLHHNPDPAGFLDLTDQIEPMGIMLNSIVYGAGSTPGPDIGFIDLGSVDPGLSLNTGSSWSVDLGMAISYVDAMVHNGSLLAVMSAGKISLVTVSRYGPVLRGAVFLADFDPPASDRVLAFLDEHTLVALDGGRTGVPKNFRVIDVTDPDFPVQIGNYPLADPYGSSLITTGSLVVVSGVQVNSVVPVQIYDGQDRLDFQHVATHDFHWTVSRIYAHGDYLYSIHRDPTNSLNGLGNFQVWDISDPANAVFTSDLSVALPSDFVMAGDWAYQVSTGLILDLSDPSFPAPAGNFSVFNLAGNKMWDVQASTEYILTGYDTAHFLVAHGGTGEVSSVGADDLPLSGRGMSLQAVPNPFNPRVNLQFDLPAASVTHLEIFDLRGRLVTDLGEKHRQAGSHSETWDGIDRLGRDLPSGVYMVRVRTDEGSASRKIVLAR